MSVISSLHKELPSISCLQVPRFEGNQNQFSFFYNRGRNCLHCGTDWVFTSDGFSFVLKRFNIHSYLIYHKAVNACLYWDIVPSYEKMLQEETILTYLLT
jgi:hypothetical protein